MELQLKHARNELLFIIFFLQSFPVRAKARECAKRMQVTFQSIECELVLEPGEVAANAISRSSRSKGGSQRWAVLPAKGATTKRMNSAPGAGFCQCLILKFSVK